MTTGPNPVKCVVALAAPAMMDAAGGTGSLAITTQPECAWDASTNVSWISGLSPASGQGTADLSFRVVANEGSSSRDGTIVVNGEQARVSQRAPCRFDIGPSSHYLGSSGGTASLNVITASDCAWTAAANVNWIALSPPATGTGNGTVAFAVAPNDGAQRAGAISIGNQRSVVTQAADVGPSPSPPSPPPPSPPPPSACAYSLLATTAPADVNEGSGAVSVSTTSACNWTAASNAPWITISSGSTGMGNGRVEYRFTGNVSAQPRTGTLTIAGLTFTVVQAGCTYALSRSADQVGASDGVGSVNVMTSGTCRWTTASSAGWLSVSAGSSGTGNGTVEYRFTINLGPQRSATLTIAGLTYTVVQGAISIQPSRR